MAKINLISRKIKSWIAVTLVFFPITLFYQNCGLERPNGRNNLASMGYAHTGQETSCNECHIAKRPFNKIGVHNFDHTDTRFGADGDCVSCHINNAGRTWAGGTYSHEPLPSSCISCHAGQRPDGIFSVNDGAQVRTFNHSTSGLGECASCHIQTSRFVDLADWAPGELKPVNLVSDRSFIVSLIAPIFNGTVVTKPPATFRTFPLEVDHASNLVSDDCLSCHTNLASGQYSGGLFHPSIASNPVACLECHKNAQPTGIVGAKGFMRHESTTWVANSANEYSESQTKIVTQDCAFCHSDNMPMAGSPLSNNPAVTPFIGASFHGKIFPANLNSCLACHAGNRPTTTANWTNPTWKDKTNVGAPPFTTFDLGRHAINVDCAQCHTAPNTATSTTANWANGDFNHVSTTANCLSCHINPSGTQTDGVSSFNHANIVSNCVGCHASSTSAFPNPVMANWRGGVSTPAGVVGEKTIASATTCTGVNAAIPNCVPTSLNRTSLGMNHSSVANLASCTNCHGSTAPTAANGKFHTAPLGVANWVPPAVGSCVNCHDPTPPPTNLASIKNLGIVGSLVRSGNGVNHASTPVAALNCNSCHTAPTPAAAKTWNTATKIHTTLSNAQLNSCKACHYNRMPNGALARKNQVTYKGTTQVPQKFSHTNSLISVTAQECLSCHKDAGVSFTSAAKNTFHNVLTVTSRCATCHVAPIGVVTSNIGAGSYNHSAIGAQDCASCHARSINLVANRIPTAADWDGGTGAPATYTIPSHVSGGITIPGYTGVHSTSSNCVSCHGVAGNYSVITDFDHQGLPAGQNSCVSCHLGAKADMTAYIAATAAITTRGFDRRHHASGDFNGKTLSCIGCHTVTRGANTFATTNGVVFPTAARTGYQNIGCGSVNAATFSCHQGGQRIMNIPSTPAATSGQWK